MFTSNNESLLMIATRGIFLPSWRRHREVHFWRIEQQHPYLTNYVVLSQKAVLITETQQLLTTPQSD